MGFGPGGGGGSSSIGEATDAALNNPLNNQALVYDTSIAKWKNATISGGGSVTAADITDATTTGRAVLTGVDAAAIRTTLGAGTSNLAIGTSGTTAKAGDYAPAKADVGLGNVDNTADINKPISNAAQAALDLKATIAYVDAGLATKENVGSSATFLVLGPTDNVPLGTPADTVIVRKP